MSFEALVARIVAEFGEGGLMEPEARGLGRPIYEHAGFELTNEEAHHSFGQDLVGQRWRLVLNG